MKCSLSDSTFNKRNVQRHKDEKLETKVKDEMRKWRKIIKPKHTKLKFDLEKLKDFNVLETYQAKIGGKLVPLTIMSNDDTNIDTMITTFNTAVT